MGFLKKFEVAVLFFSLLANLFLLAFIINPLNASKITSNVILTKNMEKKAPYDFIKEDEISFDKNYVMINVSNPVLSRYNFSGSMIPVLDGNSTGIGIKPLSEKDIHVGDIISFWENSNLVVHRVIDAGYDAGGVYFITQGDNSKFPDKHKIRFRQIDSVLIAIIY